MGRTDLIQVAWIGLAFILAFIGGIGFLSFVIPTWGADNSDQLMSGFAATLIWTLIIASAAIPSYFAFSGEE